MPNSKITNLGTSDWNFDQAIGCGRSWKHLTIVMYDSRVIKATNVTRPWLQCHTLRFDKVYKISRRSTWLRTLYMLLEYILNEDTFIRFGLLTFVFFRYFHRRYSVLVMNSPLPWLYMKKPSWLRIRFSTFQTRNNHSNGESKDGEREKKIQHFLWRIFSFLFENTSSNHPWKPWTL